MKHLGRLVAACAAMIFTLLLSYGVAQAACTEKITSQGGGSTSTCTLTGWDDNWCYYDCQCTGDESTCAAMERANGMEPLPEGGPVT